MPKLIQVLAFLLCLVNASHAQKKDRKRVRQARAPQQTLVYDNHNYLPAIKSVQLYNEKEEQSLPLIPLNGQEKLILSFDDLRADSRTFYYTIEHCTSDWKSSNLNRLEYIDGLSEDRIMDYERSINTLQPYIHYELKFPSDMGVKPKLSGNYLLKIYEDADQSRLILTRKFYVYNQQVGVAAQIIPSFDVAKRKQNQKLNLEVNLGRLQVNNPYQDVKVLVQQNRRADVQELLTKPMFVKNNQLIYNNNKTLDFPGGNEFRNLDLRSFRLLSGNVSEAATDSLKHIILHEDPDFTHEAYSFTFDENGKYFIRNNDFDEPDISADYARVDFSLKATSPKPGEKLYIVGLFNHFTTNPTNELKYDTSSESWKGSLLLKQGLYHYAYKSVMPNGEVSASAYNGNHFETENTYQVFIYYRRPATRWEELVGFAEVSTSKRTVQN